MRKTNVPHPINNCKEFFLVLYFFQKLFVHHIKKGFKEGGRVIDVRGVPQRQNRKIIKFMFVVLSFSLRERLLGSKRQAINYFLHFREINNINIMSLYNSNVLFYFFISFTVVLMALFIVMTPVA